jgi:hypothetical protein
MTGWTRVIAIHQGWRARLRRWRVVMNQEWVRVVAHTGSSVLAKLRPVWRR